MANIEYKTKAEQNRESNFNPYVVSLEEIEEYMRICVNEISFLRDKLYWIIAKNYGYDSNSKNPIYDEKATYEHFERIYDGALVSSPFEKEIIYDENVKAVDELKLYDFKDETYFRDALPLYYEIVLGIYELKFCEEAKHKRWPTK